MVRLLFPWDMAWDGICQFQHSCSPGCVNIWKVGCLKGWMWLCQLQLELLHFTHSAFSQAHPLRLDPFAISSHSRPIWHPQLQCSFISASDTVQLHLVTSQCKTELFSDVLLEWTILAGKPHSKIPLWHFQQNSREFKTASYRKGFPCHSLDTAPTGMLQYHPLHTVWS